MCVGEKRKLTIPPELGTSVLSNSSNSTLIFEVELLASSSTGTSKEEPSHFFRNLGFIAFAVLGIALYTRYGRRFRGGARRRWGTLPQEDIEFRRRHDHVGGLLSEDEYEDDFKRDG
ncbi:hypothetical protein BC937DRAFT_89673 [Endogone sp. FLAS-F59071]|nr:hypothetical protein BC937DRAFT_89673 [Endogone sp. FLAS-F59071]|eukprot:RUS17656.1 hypothetical protein BC937DRAFT_89673 [Endogone sp. FLAS-F59071]